jgi:hypothetical protein
MSLDPIAQGALEDKCQEMIDTLYEGLEDTLYDYVNEQVEGAMWACRSDEWGLEPRDFIEDAIYILKEITTKQLKGNNDVQ